LKKALFIFILIAILSFSIVGCQREENQMDQPLNDPPSEEKNESRDEKSKNIFVQSTHQDPRDEGILTRLSNFVWDLDGDGLEEKIELYTAAERHEDGNMIWDDGQNWLLLVEDENQYYPLLHQYVQLGVVYFNLWLDDEEIPNITVFVTTGANLNIVNYTYDSEEKVYIGEPIYDTGAINFLFSSFPSY